jgi:hypothetical protein
MKALLSIIPVAILLTFAATASLQAGPGAEYFKRVNAISTSAKTARDTAAVTPSSKCKVTEVVQVTTGPHGVPTHQVVGTNMDCSSCDNSSMACCAVKAKS